MSFSGFNECGNTNPTLRLAGHLSQDQALRDARIAPHLQGDISSQLVREYLEETTRHNFQTFRADELLREVQQVESPFGSSVLPPPNAIGPNVSANKDWFFNPVPPPLPPPPPFFSQSLPPSSLNYPSLPPPSLTYPSLPPTPFYRNENILRPMLPPPGFTVPSQSQPQPQSVRSVSPRPGFKPIQVTLEELEGSWDNIKGLKKGFKIVEASHFFGDNEQGTSTDRKETNTDSNVDQIVDLGSLKISEGEAKPNKEATEGSEFVSSKQFIRSKYLELLKKNQTQLHEEGSSELNRDVQTEMEELNTTQPLVEETAESLPGSEEEDEEERSDENFAMEFLRKFSGLLTNLEDMNSYPFKEPNPMLEVNDPFQEGLKRLEVGDFPSAVLCFEAAAQLQSDNAKAWQYLGISQAANEQDVHAIAALKECLKLEPTNLTALMALAVSYTNENFGNLAVIMLWKWLFHNPKYSDLVTEPPPENFTNLSSFLNPDTHKKVQDLFIKAANRNPTRNLDPDVQCALGVLFNLIGDCSKASDCFKAALSVSPGDARLWNRLGATLANGQRSAEAVEAYYRSLSLNPGYVRARYNLGVSCINLGAHKEAMLHLLKALNQQANTKTATGLVGQMSDSIWTTTRVVLSHMGRKDLVAAVDNRDLNALNQAFGTGEP